MSVVLIEGPIPVSATWIQPSFAFKNSGLGFLAAAPDPGWKLAKVQATAFVVLVTEARGDPHTVCSSSFCFGLVLGFWL